MKLKPLAFALTGGIIWGVAVMLGTWWLLIIGSSGSTIGTLANFYFGYSFSILGGLIGLVWGFVDGFVVGLVFAWLYNLFVGDEKA